MLHILLTIALTTPLLFTDDQLERKVTLRIGENSARRGDRHHGVVRQEEKGELFLDTTPCATDGEKKIVAFTAPYMKHASGRIKCGKKEYEAHTVHQK